MRRGMWLWLSFFVQVLLVGVPVAHGQWTPQVSGTEVPLRGIDAVSRKTAWASGAKGTVLRTLDGGAHWEKLVVPGAEGLDFRDIKAFDGSTAFVLSIGPGDQSRIYDTRDGGQHWREMFVNRDAKAFYDCFAFWDQKHALAVSDSVEGKFPLLALEGDTWRPLIPKTLPAALPAEGAFAASGTCIAAAERNEVWFATGGPAARVFHSADRGKNWTVVNSPLLSGAAAQGIFSVAFWNRSDGVIVGGDYSAPQNLERNAAFTSDGGRTWTLASQGPPGYRSAVTFVPHSSPLLLIAVGTGGSDYSKDAGRTWRSMGTEDFNAVSFARADAGWAVGAKGRIARFTGLPK